MAHHLSLTLGCVGFYRSDALPIAKPKMLIPKPGVYLGYGTVLWALLAGSILAPSEAAPLPFDDAPAESTHGRPGEYPQYTFRSPYPEPVFEQAEDFRRNYLLGGWFGVRSKLAAHGIKPTLFFITDPFGNPVGGKRQGFSFSNLLGLDLVVETDKAFGLPGGQFHIGFAYSSGADLSSEYVGNAFPIQVAAAGAPPLCA